MKKKLLSIVMLGSLLCFLASCGSTPKETADNELQKKEETVNTNEVGAVKDTEPNSAVAQLEAYIGNVVSGDYICYKEVAEKKGSFVCYDYDNQWHKIWEGRYEKETSEKPYIEHNYYNLYSESETVPTDKKYDEGYLWDANGNEIKHLDRHGEVNDSSVYDANNNKTEWHLWRNGKETSFFYYEFDANGFCVSESRKTQDRGYISEKYFYTNDEKGNRSNTVIQYLNEDGSVKDEDTGLTWTWQYECDEYDRITRLYAEDLERGGIGYDYKYEYDDAGHLIVSYDSTYKTYSYYMPKSEFVHKSAEQ